MPDEGDPDGLYFAEGVVRRSDGTLKVVVDSSSYPSALPANEQGLHHVTAYQMAAITSASTPEGR
jgi:hypothetical protein